MSKENISRVQYSTSLKQNYIKRLKLLANAEGISANEIIEKSINKYYRENKKIVESYINSHLDEV